MSSIELSSYILADSDPLNPSKLNEIIKKFIDDDKLIYGRFDKIPKIWKCLWYNDNSISGYARGDFFWLNTESIEEFLKNNAVEMQEITNANPLVSEKLPDWKSNNAEIYNQYYNVLTGYIDNTKSAPLQPLYAIGELSAQPQLVISLKDNNKDPITNPDSWKKFMIPEEDEDVINTTIYSGIDSAISTHNKYYHFGSEQLTYEISTSLNLYANADFSNVANMYPPNYLKNGDYASGFDTVEVYVKRPHPNTPLEGYTLENQWFRKWKSGYLEHGGMIVPSAFLNQTQDSVLVNFNWEMLDEESKAYETKFLGFQTSMLSVDESQEIPPGDNLISVLTELDRETFSIFDSVSAPIYANAKYSLNVIPCYPNEGITSAMTAVTSYNGLGDNSLIDNIVQTEILLTDISANGFSFRYSKENVPDVYYYYAAGFCTL